MEALQQRSAAAVSVAQLSTATPDKQWHRWRCAPGQLTPARDKLTAHTAATYVPPRYTVQHLHFLLALVMLTLGDVCYNFQQ